MLSTGEERVRVQEDHRVRMLYSANSSEAVRLSTIQILALMAIATGLLIAITAPSVGPSLLFFARLPGWPWLFGSALALVGVVQMMGVLASRPILALVGSAGASTWHLLFAAGFVIQWYQWHLGSPAEWVAEPSIYPCGFYIGLAILHAVQGQTILQKMKDRVAQQKYMKNGI